MTSPKTTSMTSVGSIQEYLTRIWETPTPEDTFLSLFRGQPDTKEILPKLFRKPNTPDSVHQVEAKMLTMLKSIGEYMYPSKPRNDWDWLSLGQHHGMHTRLSDWTASPLVALFFAVEVDVIDDKKPVVYHYPIEKKLVDIDTKSSPLAIRQTRALQPKKHSRRVDAQAAWHIVHAIHYGPTKGVRFIPIEDMAPHKDRITRIQINPKQVSAIRKELHDIGIKHATVYGDFEAVCRSIGPSFGIR